jgi:hypothetical protein
MAGLRHQTVQSLRNTAVALPEEWNNVDALHSYWNGESSHEAGLELQGLSGERLCAIGN